MPSPRVPHGPAHVEHNRAPELIRRSRLALPSGVAPGAAVRCRAWRCRSVSRLALPSGVAPGAALWRRAWRCPLVSRLALPSRRRAWRCRLGVAPGAAVSVSRLAPSSAGPRQIFAPAGCPGFRDFVIVRPPGYVDLVDFRGSLPPPAESLSGSRGERRAARPAPCSRPTREGGRGRKAARRRRPQTWQREPQRFLVTPALPLALRPPPEWSPKSLKRLVGAAGIEPATPAV